MPIPSPYAAYPSLRDRTILITGGATGIGASLVEAFAHQAAQVIFLDIQDEAAQSLIAQLQSQTPHSPAYYRCDLTDTTALQRCIEAILSQFPSIDVLINNAGDDTRHTTESV